jgi:hypothetical protein
MAPLLRQLATLLLLTPCLFAQPPGGGPGAGSGDGIWVRNAAFGEIETFDMCNGHQSGSGQCHHHINPVFARAQLQSERCEELDQSE